MWDESPGHKVSALVWGGSVQSDRPVVPAGLVDDLVTAQL
jgi:hypothetical protein